MARGIRGIVPQPFARIGEELLFREDIQQMQCSQIRAFLQELDGVGLAFLGDAREELRVDYQALEIGQGFGQAREEAGRVAQAEELEGEGFDGLRKGGDVPGLREQGLVFVDFDVGGEGQGFEAAGFGREVGDGEGLEGDLREVLVRVGSGGR